MVDFLFVIIKPPDDIVVGEIRFHRDSIFFFLFFLSEN